MLAGGSDIFAVATWSDFDDAIARDEDLGSVWAHGHDGDVLKRLGRSRHAVFSSVPPKNDTVEG